MQNKSFLFGCLIMVNYDYFRFYRGSENEDLEDFFSKEIESQVQNQDVKRMREL